MHTELKFLHAADIHLDSPLHGLERYEGAPVDDIRGATRRAFDRLIQLAIDESVDFVLLAGDLYDGDWKDYNTGLYFVERMGRLREAGIRAYLIAGNHDAASQISKQLRLPDSVRLLTTQKPETAILTDLDVAIHGQGFATRSVRDDLSQAYPQGDPNLFNIGLLHTCLDGKPGHAPYAPCSVDGLRSKGYQYWALGHIHTREIVDQEPWIVFPGNIQGRHMGETGPKGCTLVTVAAGAVASVQHRDLDVMRWSRCDVDVSDCHTGDAIYERVQTALQQTLDQANGRPVAARLSLYGACALHNQLHAERTHWQHEYRALGTSLGGAGLWLEKVIFDTRPVPTSDTRTANEGALSDLLQTLQQMQLNQEALAELAQELQPLRQKLPAALLSGQQAYDPVDPQQLKTGLEAIKSLLAERLVTPRKT